MSQPTPNPPASPLRGFLQGVGNIAEFARESAVALIEVAIGRWPQPFGEGRRRPKAPNEGLGPIEKIAPFPTDD